MSLLKYELTKNSIDIVKGIYRKSDILEEKIQDSNFSLLFREGKFSGIRLKDFLNNIELSGAKSELFFKEFLEKNNIPYLYIGQGPVGIEKSDVLLNKVNSKRPDFFVNLPNLGYIFVDVKSRQKLSFPNSKESYFYLFISEIEELYNLHTNILIPVWLAFMERNNENDYSNFYLLPITILNEFKNKILQLLNESNREYLNALRIPNMMLNEIKDNLNFKVGYSFLDEKIVSDFSIRMKGLFRLIESTIFETIRKNNVLKSNVSEFVQEKLPYVLKTEIDCILSLLISRNEIIYTARQPLKLTGE